TLAHLGVAVFLIGALLVEGLSVQREVALAPGKSLDLGRYSFRFDNVKHSVGPNYEADYGTVTVFDGDEVLTVLHPEKRAYASG
ncbi:cytochrome c-type biogenesis CcmF C-terminal domain-containing protein, partial [Lysobacter sp. 2RAB21]